MPLPVFRVFVSSTWEDLRPEREAIFTALHSHPQIKFVGMEDFGSRDENTHKASVEGVSDCELYVGIIGGRYGSGITEEEYREASKHERPRLIYFKSETGIQPIQRDEAPWPKLQLNRFKTELRVAHTVSEFDSPEDLARRVSADLSRWCAAETLRRVSRPNQRTRPLHQLSSPIGNFVGRRDAIKTLLESLTPAMFARVALITGLGGVGKTELAMRVGHDLQSSYPDAQLLIEFGTHSNSPLNTVEALQRVIGALRASDFDSSADLDQLTKEYRSLLSGQRALVVLDDVADISQLRAFIPPAGCALLCTSRKKMAFPGMSAVHLNQLEAYDSTKLLRSFDSRIVPPVADSISQLCGYLPLALCHAGSLLSVDSNLTPADYLERLRDERTRLEALDSEDVQISVRATFNLSYAQLSPESQRVFRQLAVFPASFDEKAEAKVCDDLASHRLKELQVLCLTSYDTKSERYRLHDLVRVYAIEASDKKEQYDAARRHGEYYCGVAQQVSQLHLRDESTLRGLELFDLEWSNFSAGKAWSEANSTSSDDVAAWCLKYLDSLKYLIHLRRSPTQQISWVQMALRISQGLGIRDIEGRYLSNLGTAYLNSGDRAKAEDCFRRALVVATECDDKLSEGNAHGNLGNLQAKAEPRAAIEHYEECLRILYEVNDGRGAGNTLNNLANAYVSLGETQLAIEYYKMALSVAREMNDRRSQAIALSNLGTEYSNQGRAEPAIVYFEEALAIMRETGDARGEVATLCSLGNAYVDVRDVPSAIQFYQQALLISHEISDRPGECFSLGNLGHAYFTLGDNKLALEYHNEALRIAEELGDDRIGGLVRWNVAQVLKDGGDIDEGIREGNRALTVLSELEDPTAQVVRDTLETWKQAANLK